MTKRFFFLDILPLCELFDLEEDRLIPCEVAAVEYSLAHGIHRSMHMFIDPGKLASCVAATRMHSVTLVQWSDPASLWSHVVSCLMHWLFVSLAKRI